MPTSVHLPRTLLEAVDRRARRLAVSRNRLIVRALERELAAESEWTPGFFERLEQVDDDDRVAVDQLLQTIRARRTRKAPRRL